MAETLTHTFSPAASVPGAEPTLGDVGRAVRRKWRWVAVPTAAAAFLSLVFVNVVAPSYTGESRLLLQTGDSYFLRMGGADRASGGDAQQIDESAVASQVQVVMSRDIAREAIRKLGLVGRSEFDPLSGWYGMLKRAAAAVGLAKDPNAGSPEDRILEKYYEHLVVYPVGRSRIVAVEFHSRDAELAARAANTIAEIYLSSQLDAQRNVAKSASNWLGSNIDDLRARVADAEAKVEAFRTRTGLLTGSGQTSLAAQQLSEMSAQLSQARATKSDAEVKAKLVRDLLREGRAFEIPDVANNELIRRLIEQRVGLRAQLALESRTLLPQHPRIKELNAQLADLDGQVRGAGERTARTLENDAAIAAARVDALDSAIAAQKKVVSDGNENEVQLRALEREARTQRDQLEGYLGRYREATARNTDEAYPAEARVVSRAVVPLVPSFPKKVPTVLLTTLAALLLSIGIVAARELLGGAATRPAVPARRDEDALLEAAVLRATLDPAPAAPTPASIASAAVASAPVVSEPVADLPAATAEPDPRYDFALLVARLTRVELDGRARRVLVTGIGRDNEAGEVSEGLAMTLAGSARTVLIDLAADDEAAVETEAGLTDLVAGEASFTDVIRREPGSRLHRVGIGTLRNEALTRGPDGLDIVLTALDETYDWVVCRLAGGCEGDLVALTAPRMDAVVIASDLEPANQSLVRAYELVREAGARDIVVAREHTAVERESEAA